MNSNKVELIQEELERLFSQDKQPAFNRISFLRIVEASGIALFQAAKPNGEITQLRVNCDGKVFYRSQGKWVQIKGILLRACEA